MDSEIRLPKTEWQREIFVNPKYLGKVIAISNEKIVYCGKTYKEVIEVMDEEGLEYSLCKVPEKLWDFRVLKFKIKSLKKHL